MNNKKFSIKSIIKVAIVLLCLLVFIGIIIIVVKKEGLNNINNSKDIIYNKNNNFLRDHKVIGIVFKDIRCTYDGSNSLISYTIVNETSNKINLYNYEILIKDKNKKILTRIEFYYNDSLLPNKEIEISNSVVGVDLSDAHYMNLKLNTKNRKKK